MKINVVGPKPRTGTRYLNPTNETKPYRILFGVSVEGKKDTFERICSSLCKKEDITMQLERIISKIAAINGKRPAPGRLVVPKGY